MIFFNFFYHLFEILSHLLFKFYYNNTKYFKTMVVQSCPTCFTGNPTNPTQKKMRSEVECSDRAVEHRTDRRRVKFGRKSSGSSGY